MLSFWCTFGRRDVACVLSLKGKTLQARRATVGTILSRRRCNRASATPHARMVFVSEWDDVLDPSHREWIACH